MTVQLFYDSNNSGGSWWLKDEDWVSLEDAGWIVHWIHDIDLPHPRPEDDINNQGGPSGPPFLFAISSQMIT